MWCTPPFIALYCGACNDSTVRAYHEPAPGLADFGGGLLTRRVPVLTVVVVPQAVAAVVLGAVVVATGGWSEAGPRLWFAVAAGVVGPVAMLSFYQACGSRPDGGRLPARIAGRRGAGEHRTPGRGAAGAAAVRGVLKERLRGVQAAGAGLALVGTVLLATG